MKMMSLCLASTFQADATLQTVSRGHRAQIPVTHTSTQGKSQILHLGWGNPCVNREMGGWEAVPKKGPGSPLAS